MITPPVLKNGDLIAIISPAGAIDISLINISADILKRWNLNVIIGDFASSSFGRYAGTKNERFRDLQWALDNPQINAILCSRGGYGTIQLVNELSFEKFKLNPKWLIGYSDITILHALIQKQGILSIHAPMCKHLALESENDFSTMCLKQVLFNGHINYQTNSHFLNKNGQATGILFGGNLSILNSLRGTCYDFVPDNKILYLEDVGEKPYQIERMFYNLKLGGILERLSGLVIGQFTGCEEDPSMKKSVYELIADIVTEFDYPVCFNFPIGHTKVNYPLINGLEANINVTSDSVFLSF